MPPTKEQRVTKSRATEGDGHVAARVKSRRLQLGMSQSELGRQIGVSLQQLQKYENGLNRIGSSRIHRIAAALRVKPEYFFDDPLTRITEKIDMGLDQFDEFCTSKDGMALMQAFVKIASKKQRRAIAALVDTLAAGEIAS